MYFGMEEKRMLVVKSALFSSNYFNYKKKRKRRQKLHNLVSKSWQAMEGSSAIYTILTLGSMCTGIRKHFLPALRISVTTPIQTHSNFDGMLDMRKFMFPESL